MTVSDYPNGHKEWLEAHAESSGMPVIAAICHAALYIGRVLEQQAWCIARTSCIQRDPPDWWQERHPNPEEMQGD